MLKPTLGSNPSLSASYGDPPASSIWGRRAEDTNGRLIVHLVVSGRARTSRFMRATLLSLVLAASLITSGCIERRFTIKTDPPGAKVFVDGAMVGDSPVELSFEHYGVRRITLRLSGHQTAEHLVPLDPPFYQYFPLDLVTELLLPFEIVDAHEAGPFTLEPQGPSELDAAAVLERARSQRQALLDAGPDAADQR